MLKSIISHMTFSSGTPHRTLKAGDEKMVRGTLMVRQQQKSRGYGMVSNGRPVWEWVERGSDRDVNRQRARYRTLRGGGVPVPTPPAGWKILESGRPVPKQHLLFTQGYGDTELTEWTGPDARWAGREAAADGPIRAFAVQKSDAELTRDYFEAGCVCILEGRIAKQPASVSAAMAVKKYLARCKCSRHPENNHAPE